MILGKKQYIDKISQHPLARAYRIDKINLAALHATLLHYIKNEALEKIPIWQMISSTEKNLRERAEKFKDQFPCLIEIIPTISTIGGGSLPGSQLNSFGIKINSNNASKLADKLRNNKDSILGRIEKDTFIIDLRTIPYDKDELLANALKEM
ncbi:MAG: hypothetical protein CL733_00615 [Chloroflexi bacterium]|nr:hypothetical protein [Chloroflexota bacterium]